jgi:glc operon protein GlcG
MRRLTMMALGAALLVSTSAFAQVPPDPNNPNEAIPDQVNVVPYGEPIKLADAKKAVVNPAGELVYFAKGDNCQNASVTISQHKARTAARYRRPTLVFERLTGKGPFFAYLATLDDVIMSRGGNPLVVGGKLIGAIGVSGGTGSQDDTISQAGVAALK